MILLGAGYLAAGVESSSKPELRFVLFLKPGRSQINLAAGRPQSATGSFRGRVQRRGGIKIWNVAKVSSGNGWSEATDGAIRAGRFVESARKTVDVKRVMCSCQLPDVTGRRAEL